MRVYLPTTGETRTVRKFAWYPMKINGAVYWLEWITVHQSYNTEYPGWNNDYVVEEP